MGLGHHHHGHSHSHGHGHGHSHGHDREGRRAANRRRVGFAFLITALFMVFEVVGGLLSGSLALLADAGHMLTDAGALGLAWAGFIIAAKPSDKKRSYGYDRIEVLAAFVNGLTLIVLAGWIVVEGISRLANPREVLAGPMLAVAVVGLFVNMASFAILHGGDRDNLNVRGALLHVAGDILGSIAAIVAAGVIMATGWMQIDPILSFLVAGLVFVSAFDLVRRSAHILLEGAPSGFMADDVREYLMSEMPDLSDVHHIHVWALTEERPLVTLHAVIREGQYPNGTVEQIKQLLKDRFGVDHVTVQVEVGACADAS